MTIGDQIAEAVTLHRGAVKKTALTRAVEVAGCGPRPPDGGVHWLPVWLPKIR
jgi:hypothetical protein